MAKMSTKDAATEALIICDRLDAVEDLNKNSRAIVDSVRAMIDTNPDSYARFALKHVQSADYMHYFFTNMHPADKDSVSYKTMRNDPTSRLYHIEYCPLV